MRKSLSILAILALAGAFGQATAQQSRTIEVNGVMLHYVDQGEGKPVVFVPAAIVDHRVWEPYREAIAREHRFIAYTQRYFGTDPWPDDGDHYSVETHAADLAAFIRALDAGPVYLVTWSYSGIVASVMVLEHPDLVSGMMHYEPTLMSVIADLPEGQTALQQWDQRTAHAFETLQAGDAAQAAKLFIEAVFERPPGGFEQEPEYMRTIWMDNARTLSLAAPPPPSVTCDDLKAVTQPTLILKGEHTGFLWPVIANTMAQCQPQAEVRVIPSVNHGGPVHAVEAFTAAILDFLASH